MERPDLPPVLRLLLAAFLAVAALAGAARAASSVDAAALAAVAAARAGDWGKAYAAARQSRDPVAAKVVLWLDYTRANPGGHFADIAGFIERNPRWPALKTLEARAEAALAAESDAMAAAWFARHPPITGIGRVRAAEIRLNRGDDAGGAAALRAAWIGGDFSAGDERAVLGRFAKLLRPQDHEKRLDRLLWEGRSEAARRMLPLVPADYRPLAEARLQLASGKAKPAAVLARVPAPLRGDPGLAFDAARWDRRADDYDGAAQLLLAHQDNPVRPQAWWNERLLVARHLLAAGNPDLAYRLVEQRAASDAEMSPDAEFLGGFIALCFHKAAALAFDDFADVLARVGNPYARSRAAYWGGRAAAAAGRPQLAAQWYAAAAANMATFYGQLAAHQLGKDAPPHPMPEPRPDAAQLARFTDRPLVAAAQLFFAAGDPAHAAVFVMQMAKQATGGLDFAMLAALAQAHGRTDLAIAVAKRAVLAGVPLMVHGYPVAALPGGKGPEHPLLLAIMRQESAFATGATSPAGARGLMQLMPATAKRVASRLDLPFSLARLTRDGIYNVTLGRSYVERLLDDFGGSYPLAIAAYNAGPGRVRQWLHQFGDPRGGDIRMVDWIEMIPFNETRAYVQRVLENLQIYRGQQADNPQAFSLVADLAR
jgi:peptidoglycan lytic transglycosylase